MISFVGQRLAVCVAAIVGASFVIFGSLYLAPGSPISFLTGGRPTTPQLRAALERQYHLNDPLFERYLKWAAGVFHGDFGESIINHQQVSHLILSRLETTVLLVLLTLALLVVTGVGLGGVAALRPGRVDDGILALMSVSVATPVFVAATFLIALFSVRLGWFPVFGAGSGLTDRINHLILPAVALAVSWWPVIGETSRSSMREELTREHVETARSRGLAPAWVFRRHVLRNSLIPISTATGLSFAGLIAGTAVVETVFQLNGVGGLLISSVISRDFPVAQAVALLFVAVFAFTNLIVDVLYATLDPRVRMSRSPK